MAPEIKALPAEDHPPTILPSDTVLPLPYSPDPSTAEVEASKIDPLYVESAKDLEAMFAEMLPHFAGKETEQNWTRREQSAFKIRRITRGNGPEKYLPQYTAGIKSMVDGLVKGCNSLRTSLSTATCHCVQDIARKLKQGLDPMVEVSDTCFQLVKLYGRCSDSDSSTGAFAMPTEAMRCNQEARLCIGQCLCCRNPVECYLHLSNWPTSARCNPGQERPTTALRFQMVDDCFIEIRTTPRAS